MPGILIDISRLYGRLRSGRLPTGVDRVSLAYIRHFRHQARAVVRYGSRKFVFRPAQSRQLFDWVLAWDAAKNPLPLVWWGMAIGAFSQNVAGCFLFNTGHNGLEDAAYMRQLQSQGVRPLFLLHDLIPLTHPQFCRRGEDARHLARVYNAVRTGQGIICNSQATLEGLKALCSQQGWRMPPHVVALLASDLATDAAPAATIDPRSTLRAAYFVIVGTLEPRKNHLMLLQIWQQLAQELGAQAPRLVIIGQRGWDFEPVSDLLATSTALQSLVTEIADCSDAQLVAYLRHAQALLFPSFAEGFGLPIVEALALGVPVLAGDERVYREFAGDIPEYVDAAAPAVWKQRILDYTANPSPRRLAQLRRMAAFVEPTWAMHFEQVEGLLARLALTGVADGDANRG